LVRQNAYLAPAAEDALGKGFDQHATLQVDLGE
jgi:hypothetical protein